MTNPTATLPPIIFGTSSLGNLYEALPYEQKFQIVANCLRYGPPIPVFDSAGKYGAGLALEVLGKILSEIGVKNEEVCISNKLGWFRTSLVEQEPTFEKGVWKDIMYDAVLKISYDGILECFEQGNQLLNGYSPQWVSVHDPDEYLSTASSKSEEELRFKKILEAYQALGELKAQGKVQAIGIGAKNWHVIESLSKLVKLDWVMFANSFTLYQHPKSLIEFINQLDRQGVRVINSAIFHGGFLIGSDYFNYRLLDLKTEKGQQLYSWRKAFYALCKTYHITPADACIAFNFRFQSIKSIALNTSKPEKVLTNMQLLQKEVPDNFWKSMKEAGLIDFY